MMRQSLKVLCFITSLWPALSFSHGLIGEHVAAALLLSPVDRSPNFGLTGLHIESINGAKMPRFAADPFWPQLPKGYLIGQISGVSVDREGDIWVVNRPNSLHPMDTGALQKPPISLCCKPLDEVIEFSPDGRIKRNWSGRGSAPTIDGELQYPSNIHGIFVDSTDTVWIAGNGPGDHLVMRYTAEGDYLGQFGLRNETNGNLDRQALGNPADISFDPVTSQVLIYDGYTNRIIIEFNYETKKFINIKVLWERPEDVSRQRTLTSRSGDNAGGRSRCKNTGFSDIVHCIAGGPDQLLYVCDRQNNRVQVFAESQNGAITYKESIKLRL